MNDALPVRMYDLGPSPNSKKVRLALGYKGISHELIGVDPADRSAIVAVSGQPLTPVLVHGETVVFDSRAILRYLEANVKREPRLFSADMQAMRCIETWEQFGRTRLGPCIGGMFGQFFAPERDPEAIAEANRQLDACTVDLEEGLADTGFLVGSSLTAADLACACGLGLALLSEGQAASHPILGFFRENLRIAPEREVVRRWYAEVNRYDGASS